MNITTRWRWLQRKAARTLWVVAVLYVVAGLISVLLGVWLTPLIPPGASDWVSPDAVSRVLGILASSMLAVTTFSMATLVTAHASVTGSTSPRATELVINNDVTRHALSVFIGTFLFSLVGIVALNAGVYGGRGHVVLFAVTVLIILLIVVALLRWIEHLSQLAKVTETAERVETQTNHALLGRARFPGIGGRPCMDVRARIPAGARPIYASTVGYVQHIDMAALLQCSDAHDLELFVLAEPGTLVHHNRALIYLEGGEVDDAVLEGIEAAFSLGSVRTFDYDPRFGLIVLAEIASRALSPGINDSGTAIDIIGRVTRVLSQWATTPREDTDSGARVWFPELSAADLLQDVFAPVARDGAGILSIQVRLQKALAALAELPHESLRAAAQVQSQRAWERASESLAMPWEREELRPLVLQDAS